MPEPYPVNLDVTSPPRVARWRPLLNWILVIPAMFWLGILHLGVTLVVILNWFIILITGRLPEGLGSFVVAVLRYQWRVTAWLYAWTDQYPGFAVPSGYPDPGDYPALFTSEPEAQRSRLTVLLRAILVIPQFVVLYFVGIVAGVVLLLAWFAVLFTGKWPEGMRDFAIGYERWYMRAYAYALLVTDVYPPFRLAP